MSRNFMLAVLLIAFLVPMGLTGCSNFTKKIPLAEAEHTPNKAESVVVFLRPAGFGMTQVMARFGGGADQYSSLYDSTGKGDKYITILQDNEQHVYTTTPGKKLFMVTAENADFLEADLLPGKTYYVIVRPRPGFLGARFSLDPVHKAEYEAEGKKIEGWRDGCDCVINTDLGLHNAGKLEEHTARKRAEYIKKWNARPAKDRVRLVRGDWVK